MQHHSHRIFKILLFCSALAWPVVFSSYAFSALPDYVLIGQWSAAGPGSSLNAPQCIAADAFGNVYVADTGNNRIVKYSTTGRFKAAWGSYGPLEGQFRSPLGIAVDSVGNVYVADMENLRIQKFTSYGEFISQWESVSLYLAVSPGGDVYTTRGNGTECFSPTGELLLQWSSSLNYFVRDIAVAPSGDVYVIGGNSIQKYTAEGDLLTAWGSFGGGGPGKFNMPLGLAVDAAGDVYVADTYNRCIQKFSPIGEFITQWWYRRRPLQDLLALPVDLAIDKDGYVYVLAGSKVLVFAPAGSVFGQLIPALDLFLNEAPAAFPAGAP